MPSPIPTWAPAWLLARDSAEAGVLLVTIVHSTFETMRLVNHPTDVTSRTMVFTAAAFEASLVNDDGKPPAAAFKFPNILPEIGRRLARVVDPVEITFECISLAHLDEPLPRHARLQMRNIKVLPDTITAMLMGRDYSAEQLGKKTVVPARFPAMFSRRG